MVTRRARKGSQGLARARKWRLDLCVNPPPLRAVVVPCPPTPQTMWPIDESAMSEHAIARRKMFLATTTAVIFFTVFIQGGLTFSVLGWLGIEV